MSSSVNPLSSSPTAFDQPSPSDQGTQGAVQPSRKRAASPVEGLASLGNAALRDTGAGEEQSPVNQVAPQTKLMKTNSNHRVAPDLELSEKAAQPKIGDQVEREQANGGGQKVAAAAVATESKAAPEGSVGSLEDEPKRPTSEAMQKKFGLMPHQKEALDKIAAKDATGEGLLLGHQPGLGKTRTVMTYLHQLAASRELGPGDTALVLAPNISILEHWKVEYGKMQELSGEDPLGLHLYMKSGRDRKLLTAIEQNKVAGKPTIIFTTYDTYRGSTALQIPVEKADVAAAEAMQVDSDLSSPNGSEQSDEKASKAKRDTLDAPVKSSPNSTGSPSEVDRKMPAKTDVVTLETLASTIKMVAADEGDILRESNNKIYERLAPLMHTVPHKVIMTASPLQNNFSDLINQAKLLSSEPEKLDRLQSGLKSVFNAIKNSYKNVKEINHRELSEGNLRSLLAPFHLLPTDDRSLLSVLNKLRDLTKDYVDHLTAEGIGERSDFSTAYADYKLPEKPMTETITYEPGDLQKRVSDERFSALREKRNIGNDENSALSIFNLNRRKSTGKPEDGHTYLGTIVDLKLLADIPQVVLAQAAAKAGIQDMRSPKIDALGDKLATTFETADTAIVTVDYTEKVAPTLVSDLTAKFQERVEIRQYNGNLNANEKEAVLRWFKEDVAEGAPKKLLVLASKAGERGIDLQHNNHVFLFNGDFNPERMQQKIGRSNRIGQKEGVTVYQFKGLPIDEMISEVRERKEMLIRNVWNMDPTRFLKEMLGYIIAENGKVVLESAKDSFKTMMLEILSPNRPARPSLPVQSRAARASFQPWVMNPHQQMPSSSQFPGSQYSGAQYPSAQHPSAQFSGIPTRFGQTNGADPFNMSLPSMPPIPPMPPAPNNVGVLANSAPAPAQDQYDPLLSFGDLGSGELDAIGDPNPVGGSGDLGLGTLGQDPLFPDLDFDDMFNGLFD